MKTFRIFTLLSVLLITGCASPGVEHSSVQPVSLLGWCMGGLFALPAEESDNNSLEFASYQKEFEIRLVNVGYDIEEDPVKADYIALVSYGIDKGETATITTPIYGYSGWGTGFSHRSAFGPHHRFGYFGTHYFMPVYGVIGSSTDTITVYNRTITLDIVDADSFRQGNPQKVYEGRTKSIGRCPVFAEVFDELLAAMFSDFPGENGRNRKQVVEGELNC